MRNVPPQAAMIAAVGILGAGAAWAGSMFLSEPEPSSIQPQQLRELAAKVQSAPSQAPTLVVPASAAIVRPQVVVPRAPEKKKPDTTIARVISRTPALPPVQKSDPPAPPPAPEDPVKNLALMGVTHESNTDRAWLVDLSSREKEAVAVGGTAFGFTVKKIAGETVTLGRGPSEYTLRLGEKQLPVIVASTSGDGAGGSEDGDDGNPFGRGGRDGRDGRDGRSPFGGFGSFGGGDFRSRFSGFSGFGGFGGSSSGWSGRSWGGDSGRSWGSSGDSGRGGDSSRWSSSSGRGSWGGGSSSWSGGRSSFGGGFSGGGFSGGGFSGGGWSGSSGRSSQTGFAGATSTSNPQTSRRNGARLTGGVTSAQETPAAITNPQTQRRNGSTGGQAFGQENSSGRGSYNNSNSNNRLGYGR